MEYAAWGPGDLVRRNRLRSVHCDTCQNREAQHSWRRHREVLSDHVRSEWTSESFYRGHHVLKITPTKLTCWYRSCYPTAESFTANSNNLFPAVPRNAPPGVVSSRSSRVGPRCSQRRAWTWYQIWGLFDCTINILIVYFSRKLFGIFPVHFTAIVLSSSE